MVPNRVSPPDGEQFPAHASMLGPQTRGEIVDDTDLPRDSDAVGQIIRRMVPVLRDEDDLAWKLDKLNQVGSFGIRADELRHIDPSIPMYPVGWKQEPAFVAEDQTVPGRLVLVEVARRILGPLGKRTSALPSAGRY